MTPEELEERLINFSVLIIKIANSLEKTYTGNHFAGQIVRSGSSPALNYGEAQSGESKRDFIHKMGICLKELRETFICLRIIEKAELSSRMDLVEIAKVENNELISIFVKSIKTAKDNQDKKPK